MDASGATSTMARMPANEMTAELPDCRVAGRRAGIDEAGYGPLLGPLAIAQAIAVVRDQAAFTAELALLGVDDSKALHDPRDLARLERVALGAVTWLTGSQPRDAATVFALLGETASDRAYLPWMAGAEDLLLPASATTIPPFAIAHAEPLGLSGALLHPQALNDAARNGRNRAQVEWDAIGGLVAAAASGGAIIITCDRLGGRRYYSDPLATVFPWRPVAIVSEAVALSRYRVLAETGEVDIAFVVGGERADPLVALASCVAKYARELHLRLFNGWWGQRRPGLRPTAGYGSDAHRWLRDIDPGDRLTFAAALIRGDH